MPTRITSPIMRGSKKRYVAFYSQSNSEEVWLTCASCVVPKAAYLNQTQVLIDQNGMSSTQLLHSDAQSALKCTISHTSDFVSGMRIMRATTVEPSHSMRPGNSKTVRKASNQKLDSRFTNPKGGINAKVSPPHLNRRDNPGRAMTKV